MKNIFYFVIVCIFSLFILSCDEKDKKIESEKNIINENVVEENDEFILDEINQIAVVEDEEVYFEIDGVETSEFTFIDVENYPLINNDFSYRAKLVEDNVVVRSYPSVYADSVNTGRLDEVFVVTGYSLEKDFVDGYEGYWVQAYSAEEETFGSQGWIFSKYIELNPEIEPSTITIDSINDDKITILVKRNGAELPSIKTTVINENYLKKDFALFRWSSVTNQKNYVYSDVPGIYAVKDNQVIYLCEYGQELESAWVRASDDMKYVFQDLGTGSSVRGLEIYDVENHEIIYKGSYYSSIEYDGNEITIAVPVRDYMSNIDEESLNHAANSKPSAENEETIENTGLTLTCLVLYRYDFVNDVRTFKECQWIGEQ